MFSCPERVRLPVESQTLGNVQYREVVNTLTDTFFDHLRGAGHGGGLFLAGNEFSLVAQTSSAARVVAALRRQAKQQPRRWDDDRGDSSPDASEKPVNTY